MSLDISRVKTVLFDIDGTLADTDDDLIRRAARILQPVSWLFPERDPKPFLRWGLMTAETPLNTLMGIPDWLGLDDELVTCWNRLSDLSRRLRRAHFVLMAGAETMLARLAPHYPLGVVSARSERGTQAFLEQFGLRHYFSVVVSAQTAPHTKPYPDPVQWAARVLGTPVDRCIMVGDTPVDILAGRRAGAQTVGVLCGLGKRVNLERASADLILEHTTDLADVLCGPSV